MLPPIASITIASCGIATWSFRPRAMMCSFSTRRVPTCGSPPRPSMMAPFVIAKDNAAFLLFVLENDVYMSNDVEFDEDWSTRMPTSARRYQSIPDVRMETGRRQSDELLHTDSRNYASGNTRQSRTVIPPRRTATQTGLPAVQSSRQRNIYTDDIQPLGRTRRVGIGQGFNFHWLVFVGIAMLIMIIGWVAFNALGSWWQTSQDDWYYGGLR